MKTNKNKINTKKLFLLYQCEKCKKTYIEYKYYCTNCNSYFSIKPATEQKQVKIFTLDQIPDFKANLYHTPLDPILPDGLPEGSMTILAGTPGAGKSTTAIKTCFTLIKTYNLKTLYISSEEPPQLIKTKISKLNLPESNNFLIFSDTNLENIANAIKQTEPDFIALDSINAVKSRYTNSAPGSPNNIIRTLNTLQRLRLEINEKRKESNQPLLTILIIAHATKQKTIAGPLTLQHMVDIVLFMSTDKNSTRTLSSLKNRFAPAGFTTTYDPNL